MPWLMFGNLTPNTSAFATDISNRTACFLDAVPASKCASGSGKQFFHYKGKRIGHVIDPRTGRPASEALSITIQTQNATAADAYSTACFVQGLDATAKLVRENQVQLTQGNEIDGPSFAIAVTETGQSGEVKLKHLGRNE